jgi:hypothetical protein
LLREGKMKRRRLLIHRTARSLSKIVISSIRRATMITEMTITPPVLDMAGKFCFHRAIFRASL